MELSESPAAPAGPPYQTIWRSSTRKFIVQYRLVQPFDAVTADDYTTSISSNMLRPPVRATGSSTRPINLSSLS